MTCASVANSPLPLAPMNKTDARRVLSERLELYRQLPYSDLAAKVGRTETAEVPNDPGAAWQLEFQVVWDGPRDGDVRVIGSIDDGGIRAFIPVTDSFIKRTNGTFVGDCPVSIGQELDMHEPSAKPKDRSINAHFRREAVIPVVIIGAIIAVAALMAAVGPFLLNHLK